MTLDVLLVGSGGREHALAWKLAQSPSLGRLYAAPGNPGIFLHADDADLDVTDHDAVLAFCHARGIDLVVIGPEAPLVAGLADAIRAAGIATFGPSAAAAMLEGSKGFTKDLCARAGIPTAAYARFTDLDAARRYVQEAGAPIVIKADGLAAGKGVTVAATVEEALEAVDACLSEAGGAIVVEECMVGPEASFFCLCDGERAVPFGTAEDHKRVFDGDRGPNTGGMGAYSPSVLMDEAMTHRAMAEIIEPTMHAMRDAGTPFSGVLYAGLMLTAEGPKLIEYNVRFGDPEAQVLMMRLESDLLPILKAAADGDLSAVEPVWRPEPAVTVVMAAAGYPGPTAPGAPIGTLPPVEQKNVVFQAGTAERDGRLVATGGRVLAATAMGTDFEDAIANAYALVDRIDFPGGFSRRDIAHRARAAKS